MDFPSSPSDGDTFNGFIYNGTLGVWDVLSSLAVKRFTITNSSSSAYVFSGDGTSSDSNPTLYLTRGETYEFVVNASGHPFYIKTVSGTGTSNAYTDGVIGNGAETGTITFTVQMDAPDTLYYNCSVHSAMAGTIYVVNSTLALNDFSVTTASAGTAALSYSNGVFTYTPPDLSSYLTAETNDLTSAVTWANVPNANITESSVTQHEAALSITSTQVTDFGEAVDDQVNTLLQAGLGVDFTYDDANNELLIDSNHVEVNCTNNSGSSIPIGTPVYQTGVSGNNITIAPADADDSSKMPAIGITTSTLADEAEGTIIVLGVVSGLDTSSFSAGDTVYVSTTAGELTTTPPTGESGLIQNFGRVLKVNASSGSIAVMGAGRANAVPNLNDGNIFIGNSSNQAEARALVEADISDLGTYLTGITSENIGSLSDVTISSVAAGELLRYDGSGWVNSDPVAGRFSIVNSSSSAYVFTGSGTSSDSNPTLYLTRGQTYEFVVNASGHPFYIKTVSGTGTGNAYSDGVTNNGAAVGTVTLDVQMDAPDTLYYNCSVHSAMAGTIYILDSTVGLSDFSVTTASAGTAALSYSNGIFTFTPPDLSSYLTGITAQSIENLSDVNSMTPSDGQVLTWDNTNSYWYAASPSGGSYSDSSVDTHLNTSTASTNEVLSWNGSDYSWVAQSGGGGGGASVTSSDTAPSSPSAGDLWYDTTTLRLYVYYNDGSSSQWVKANPSGSSGGGGASVTASDTAPSSPSAGDLWFNSTELVLYVYYNDGDSSQWVQSNPTGGESSSSGGVTTGKAIAMAMIFGG